MAKKAERKNTNDLQARIQAEEFWRSRARWLAGDDDKSLAKLAALTPGRPVLPAGRKPQPKRKSRKPSPHRQLDRAIQAIQKRYGGAPPDEVSTETVRAEIAVGWDPKNLDPKSQRRKIPSPSWQTVDRARRVLKRRSK
jgi:hypothetical protein